MSLASLTAIGEGSTYAAMLSERPGMLLKPVPGDCDAEPTGSRSSQVHSNNDLRQPLRREELAPSGGRLGIMMLGMSVKARVAQYGHTRGEDLS